MRNAPVLLPLLMLGMAACAPGGSAPTRVSVINTPQGTSIGDRTGYMSQADSTGSIVVPGDASTEAQPKFQPPNSPLTDVTPMTTADNSPDIDNQRLADSWPRQ
jgi:hypothetical protein